MTTVTGGGYRRPFDQLDKREKYGESSEEPYERRFHEMRNEHENYKNDCRARDLEVLGVMHADMVVDCADNAYHDEH